LIHAWWRSAGEPGGGAALLPGFLVLFCGCGWAYLMAARALKMPETAYLDRVLKRAKPS
jgi:hypothetical protein